MRIYPLNQNPQTNFIWLDLEMTGLSPSNHRIIEIATIVTDNHLNIIKEGPVIAVHQSDNELSKMDAWNQKQHNKTGLVTRVRESQISEAMAEHQTLSFLRQYVTPGSSPMCGNSIGQDRRFLARYMPELCHFFHYRNLDVSTLKILASHWAPKAFKEFRKKSQHIALQDIKDSIEELRYYRENFLQVEI
ncbi:MAG: oligoribonuclease [Gammaproteobacteria bacterium RIFCSPHIGHO2_12_FULL_41_15]|nr:MAG: oligoribonuclease [Gammaproteobacteria bacterium RIFCSPHIGHO2_12_FULL_41_15]